MNPLSCFFFATQNTALINWMFFTSAFIVFHFCEVHALLKWGESSNFEYVDNLYSTKTVHKLPKSVMIP